MSRKGEATLHFREGYNCAQSLAFSFKDLLVPEKMSEETLLRLASPFGGGMGRLREVCGAFSSAVMILGLLYGYSSAETGEIKKALYTRVQALGLSFENLHGSLRCQDLLGLKERHSEPTPDPRNAAYYQGRPCEALIGDMAAILEAYIEEHPCRE